MITFFLSLSCALIFLHVIWKKIGNNFPHLNNIIFMGAQDMEQGAFNVIHMCLLGAQVFALCACSRYRTTSFQYHSHVHTWS
jgi:hypothetical protein